MKPSHESCKHRFCWLKHISRQEAPQNHKVQSPWHFVCFLGSSSLGQKMMLSFQHEGMAKFPNTFWKERCCLLSACAACCRTGCYCLWCVAEGLIADPGGHSPSLVSFQGLSGYTLEPCLPALLNILFRLCLFYWFISLFSFEGIGVYVKWLVQNWLLPQWDGSGRGRPPNLWSKLLY